MIAGVGLVGAGLGPGSGVEVELGVEVGSEVDVGADVAVESGVAVLMKGKSTWPQPASTRVRASVSARTIRWWF